jgi:RNA recognition motif-containing protein
MSVRLFVGNLPYDATEADLREFFLPVGPLSTVIIPIDRETGKRRGFAFVEFSDPAHAAEANRRLNNQPFKGRNIAINEARAKEARTDSGPAGSRPGGYSPRPAFVPRTPRPGFAPRPAFNAPEFTPDQTESDRTARAERRSRNFGPDSRPVRKRKPHHEQKGEMGTKKGPLRERGGGQIFGADDDDDSDFDYLSEFRDTDEEGTM